MHIKVERIFLSSLTFDIKEQSAKDLKFQLNISLKTGFPEENQLIQHVTFELVHEDEAPPFDLRFTFIGHYSSEGDGTPTLKDFAKIHAPAYVVPYARELIANITSRTSGIIPTLVMPPVNIVGLQKNENTIDDQNSV